MYDSTGDACWQKSVCAFSCNTHTHTHTHTHIKMLTRIINLQVCASVMGQARMGEGREVMGWDGKEKGGDDRWFLSIWAFILPEPLKTVVLGWEKIHRGGVLKACGARWRSSRQILSRLKKVHINWKAATGTNSMRIYHLNTGRGTVWGGDAPPLISLSFRRFLSGTPNSLPKKKKG